jgi:hypothetical protein
LPGFEGARLQPRRPARDICFELGAKFAQHWNLKRALVAGVVANLVSMSLLAASKFPLTSPDAAFGLLLVATGALGLCFGATVLALNTYTESFFPGGSDRALLALNALLGVGAALAPHMPGVAGDIHRQPRENRTGNQAGCQVQDRGAEERAKPIKHCGARQPPQQSDRGRARKQQRRRYRHQYPVLCHMGGQRQVVRR